MQHENAVRDRARMCPLDSGKMGQRHLHFHQFVVQKVFTKGNGLLNSEQNGKDHEGSWSNTDTANR